jgi:hypothetical protein
MGMRLVSVLDNWAGGVNTTLEADALPLNTSPRGWNSALVNVGGGKASVMKRRGMSIMNAAAITGSPVVLGLFEYRYLASGAFTNYFLAVSDGGRLDLCSTAGAISTVSATAFTAGTLYPDFEQANNLCFIANGTNVKKVTGAGGSLALQNFGIATPLSAPTLADEGTSGSHNGTYEARVTYYNSTTGHESSAGPTSATQAVTSKKLGWSAIPDPSAIDTQVSHVRLYLRNTGTMANFYLAASVAAGTTTATTNVADTALTTIGPDTASNDPPPSGVKYLAWHKSYLFAATDTTLNFSLVNDPESFDPDNSLSVGEDDGQRITGLAVAFDQLIVFKSESIYAVVGDAPNNWSVQLLVPDIGCMSHRSITLYQGLLRWWSNIGPVEWSGTERPVFVGQTLLGDTIADDTINYAQLGMISAAVDVAHLRVVYAVPEVGQTRLTRLIPWNYQLGVWESDKWDPMDVGALGTAHDANDSLWMFIGNCAGQLFKWWNADNDGVAAATTMSGTFTAAGTSATTIAGTGFDTAGAGLIERKLTVCDSDGRQVGSVRSRITSNDATSITFTPAVSGLTIGAVYTYYLGGPAFEWDTVWDYHTDPRSGGVLFFYKKRYEFLYTQAAATSSAITASVDLAFNFDTSAGQTKAVSFATTAPTALWDVAIWDSSSYGTQAFTSKKLRVGRTGRAYRARYRQFVPNQSFALLRVGMQAELLTTKLG